MRVLVVDDDPEVRRVVRRSLEREGFHILEAGDGKAAVRSAQGAAPDVAVLDLHLPDTSGLDLLKELRALDPTLHTIMLSGAGSEADRVTGLMSGADDYMVKPFSARELAARVIAAGRRRTPPAPQAIESGGLRIDVLGRVAALGDDPIDLTRREFDLLAHLASHPGRTFSREELLQAVWGSSAEWQSPATVTEHIRRLRSKIELDPANPVWIATVRGAGYRFDPPPNEAHRRPAQPLARAAADGAQDATIVVAGRKVVHANRAALELVGAREASDVVGHDVFDFVAPQSLGAAISRQQSLREGRAARPEVITIVRPDGEERLVEVASMVVLWEGEPASQVTLWDLEGDTSTLRELATGIRTDVADAVVIADVQLRIQSFNSAAEELYGWREDEVLGRVTMEVLPWLRDDLTFERARDSIQRHGRWNGVIVQQRRDGSTVTVRSATTLLRDDAGHPVGVISVNRPVQPGSAARPAEPTGDEPLYDEIRRAIERRELVVHYQPVVRLRDGAWVGVEALVRWQHPEQGLLGPASFIDAAERSGAIVDLGQLVLEEACRQWAAWREQGIDLHVSVNLSTRQLTDSTLVDRVAGVTQRHGVPAGALWLEVTETSLVEDLEEATAILGRLVELGAHVIIDDFGTGWASLTYLHQFPVSALKIDRVFVDGLGNGATDAAIVGSIISLGKELGLSVVAEGIERPQQLSHLLRLGCELGQGYLFARPQPPDDLVRAIGA